MNRLPTLAAVLASALLCACPGGGSSSSSSSSSSSGTGSSGGGGSSSMEEGPDVTGVVETRVLTELGVSVLPVDISAFTIKAFVPDGSGGTSTISGSGTPIGRFTIPGVPMGTYTLQVGSQIVVTQARRVELQADRLGRLDALANVANTRIALTGTLARPYLATSISVLSLGSAGSANAPPWVSGAPAVNATALTNAAINWSGPIVEAGKGDRLTISQYSLGTAYNVLVGSTVVEGITTQGGMTTRVAANIAPVEATQNVHLGWLRSEHQTMIAALPPAMGPVSPTFRMTVGFTPEGQDQNFGTRIPLAYLDRINDFRDENVGDVAYPPPPSGMQAYVSASMRGFRTVYAEGATVAASIQWEVATQRRVDDVNSAFGAPVWPVSNLRINGTDAFAARGVSTLTPTLTWDAPSHGTPTAYRAQLYRIENNNGTTKVTFVATVTTTETQASVPAGVLQDGQAFVVVLQAHDSPVDLTRRPTAVNSLSSSRAELASNVFRATTSGTLPAPQCADATLVAGAIAVPDTAPTTCFRTPSTFTVPSGQVLPLGVHTTGERVSFNVPAGTQHVGILFQSVNSTDRAAAGDIVVHNDPGTVDLTLPGGTVIENLITGLDAGNAQRTNFNNYGQEDLAYIGLPNASLALQRFADGGAPAGEWSFRVEDLAYFADSTDAGLTLGGALGNTYDVSAVVRGSVAQAGTVDLDVHLGSGAITAAQAPTHPAILRWQRGMQDILGNSGICLGTITFHDVPTWLSEKLAAGIGDDVDPCGPLAQMRALTAHPEALQVWLIPLFSGGAIGLSAGIPGMQGNHSIGSGLVATNMLARLNCTTPWMARTSCGPDELADTVTHEMGHFLGLFHTTESPGSYDDPLEDTGSCACSVECVGDMRAQQCGGTTKVNSADCTKGGACSGGDNLMFWLSDSNATRPHTLTEQQKDVIRRHPLVH